MGCFNFPAAHLRLEVDDSTGLVRFYFEDKPRIEEMGFFLNYAIHSLGHGREEVEFEDVEEKKGKDPLGSYVAVTCVYQLPYLIGETPKLRQTFRVYEDRPLVSTWLENTCRKPVFPSYGDTGGLNIKEFPGFRSGLFSSLTTEGGAFAEHRLVRELERFSEWGIFLLMEYEDEVVACMVPVNNWGQRTRIKTWKRGLSISASGFDGTRVYNRIPGCVIAFGRDPYSAVEDSFEAAVQAMERKVRLSAEKTYPEIFDYLGWCSWNAFWREVSREKVISSAEIARGKGIPVKFFLVDDGWMTSKGKRLSSFSPDEGKFEGGFEALAKELKGKYGIRYLGLWHTLQGYWDGIDPESELYDRYKDSILEGTDGRYIPSPMEMKGFKFYLDWYRTLRKWGIDFVKVDNQSDLKSIILNKTPVEEAMGNLLSSVHAAARIELKGIINCMGMATECAYRWSGSEVSRVSHDYAPGDKDRAKKQIIDLVYNSLWFSQLTYPDYDMFQSHDPYAKAHALSRAISGGPIYLTDNFEKSDTGLIKRLCLKDGRILRPDEPALPTRDCLFRDPYDEQIPLKALTKVGEIGLVMAVNVNKDGVEEEVEVRPADAHLDPGKEYAIYQYFAGKLEKVCGNGAVRRRLRELECELFIVSPVEEGFAPIGLVDKFIAPKGVAFIEKSRLRSKSPGSGKSNRIAIRLKEEGTFLAYLEVEDVEVLVDGERCKRVEKIAEPNAYAFENRKLVIAVGGKNIEILPVS